MFERFSATARSALIRAGHEAIRFGHDAVAGEHLLIALLSDQTAPLARLLAIEGVYADAIRGHLWGTEAARAAAVVELPRITVAPPLTAESRAILEDAVQQSVESGHAEALPEHILLAALGDDDRVAVRTVRALGANVEVIRRQVLRSLGEQAPA